MLRLLALILIFVSVGAFAQQKYFFKTFAPKPNTNGLSIEKIEDEYFVIGGYEDFDYTWDSFAYKMNAGGDSIGYNVQNFDDFIDQYDNSYSNDTSLLAVGFTIAETPDSQKFYIAKYNVELGLEFVSFMTVNDPNSILALSNYKYAIAGAMIDTSDFVIKPSMNFFDPLTLEETAFYRYDTWQGDTYMYDACVMGEFIYGAVGSDCLAYSNCDPYLAKFDFDGNLVNNVSLTNGFFDYTNPNVIEPLANGDLLVFMTLSHPNSDYPNTGYMILDTEGNKKNEELYFLQDEIVVRVSESNNGDWVICTSYFNPEKNHHIDIGIIRTDNDGNIKWKRTYGGDLSDYAYDMLVEEDGSIVITGRYESTIPIDTAISTYLLKTNCMGLLTEPQAAFGFQSCGLITEFENQSLYVYPDSIDGGYYTWDFGDGATSDEINPTHSYTDEGVYQVSLTGIVCQDTSIVTFPVHVAIDTCYTFVDVPIIDEKAIRLYPNPAADYLNVSIEGEFQENLFLEIYGINGALLHEREINSNNERVSIDRFESGLYTYVVYSRKGILKRGKLVVK